MKFIAKNGYEVSFLEEFSFTNKDVSPIKEILERKDFSQYSFVSDKETPLSDLLPIQVNILDVGQCIYFFNKDEFDKDSFVENVSRLKEMSVASFYDVLTKVRTLDEVTLPYNALFVIYNPIGKFRIFEDCFKTLNLKNNLIYVSLKENNAIVVKGEAPETKPAKKKEKVEKVETAKENNEETKEPKEKKGNGFLNKVKSYLFNPISVIKKDKFHFLFALIATFLIGFTLSIGIFNAYAGKLICIFFFICSLAGSFLNFMIYKDAFKTNKFGSPFVTTTIISSVIGLGLSIGGYYIFKATSNEVLAITPHILMILGIVLFVYMASSSIPLLIDFIKNKKRKK